MHVEASESRGLCRLGSLYANVSRGGSCPRCNLMVVTNVLYSSQEPSLSFSSSKASYRIHASDQYRAFLPSWRDSSRVKRISTRYARATRPTHKTDLTNAIFRSVYAYFIVETLFPNPIHKHVKGVESLNNGANKSTLQLHV